MLLFFVLLFAEIFTPVVFRQLFYNSSRVKYYIIIIIHAILSMWLWILFFEIVSFRGFYDDPFHIWMQMNMRGVIVAVVAPRILLILMHFTGVFIRRKEGNYIRRLSLTGFILSIVILTVIAFATLHGRFNVRTDRVSIYIKELHDELDGLKIVHISDLHLATFHNHRKVLKEVMDQINDYNPDLIINTGDFISFGWREYGRFDTILSVAESRYGNYAVMGNHDFGTYHPDYTEADLKNNVLNVHRLIRSSGYTLLNDEFITLDIGDAKLAVIGVITKGRHPDITHGDIDKAISGLDSADLKILLSHDPNHWEMAVTGKTDIDVTFSGHTHGMQMGILLKNFRWSPAKFFYPNWSGHYTEGDQHHYVNRGLGILSVPFRIWMPPEVTVITLKKE
jgi:uncharacterized protein